MWMELFRVQLLFGRVKVRVCIDFEHLAWLSLVVGGSVAADVSQWSYLEGSLQFRSRRQRYPLRRRVSSQNRNWSCTRRVNRLNQIRCPSYNRLSNRVAGCSAHSETARGQRRRARSRELPPFDSRERLISQPLWVLEYWFFPFLEQALCFRTAAAILSKAPRNI